MKYLLRASAACSISRPSPVITSIFNNPSAPLTALKSSSPSSQSSVRSLYAASTNLFNKRQQSPLPPCTFQQNRSYINMPVANWKSGKTYLAIEDEAKKAQFVPKPRGNFKDPASFLTAIGRGCGDFAPKFTSWDHLFTATAEEMEKTLSIPVRARRHILGWREWFKRGRDPYAIAIPKRAKKYLKEKAQVKLLRLKKEGKA
ncbi:hypothetical protein HDU97_001020 [Phlyctochytrium planicorne]|nr:hypothetical protein HDU97_001020 [Phlyctochytrium planicorne]